MSPNKYIHYRTYILLSYKYITYIFICYTYKFLRELRENSVNMQNFSRSTFKH